MENKRYLDKVVEHLVRGTKINRENGLLYFSYIPFPDLLSPYLHSLPSIPTSHFSKYCKYTYGLTDDEIEYVWNGYKDNILDKIENGQ